MVHLLAPMPLTDGIFDAFKNMSSDVYKNVVGCIAIVSALALIAAIAMWMFSNDERRISMAKSWVWRAVIGLAAILCAGAIIAYIITLTNSYHFDSNTTVNVGMIMHTLV